MKTRQAIRKNDTTGEGILYMAMGLLDKKWKACFSDKNREHIITMKGYGAQAHTKSY